MLITLLICSHQARASLDAALASIAQQDGASFAEVVLVNNGFSAARAVELRANWPALNLRIINEPRPGLGFARRAGFAAATGRFLVLLDDDNTVAPGFLRSLAEDIEADPQLGAVIPVIEPVWENPPPEWVVNVGLKCLSYNAVGPVRPRYSSGQYWPPGTVVTTIRPPGGGMMIRADVARHYLATIQDARRISLARRPNSLVGCEDEDIFRGVVELGLAARFDERLKVFHHIPQSRTTLNYLFRLNLQMSYSYGILYGYVKPQAHFSAMMEARRLLHNGGGCLNEVLHRRMAVRQSIVELAREIGWTAGRWQFTRERRRAA